jgi:N-acetylglutamate synthase-like GNAT family acetyltransferase
MLETAQATPSRHTIEIHPLQPGEDTTAFRTLNEEWITRYFTLEAKDIETLGDPENAILRKGGHIFLARAIEASAASEGSKTSEASKTSENCAAPATAETVGCVALIPMGDRVYELSKMAVSPRLRGLGIGRVLLEFAIAQARRIGARSLFLGSSTKLANAVHLYESVGFQHVPPERLPPMPYARADVFMELPLS